MCENANGWITQMESCKCYRWDQSITWELWCVFLWVNPKENRKQSHIIFVIYKHHVWCFSNVRFYRWGNFSIETPEDRRGRVWGTRPLQFHVPCSIDISASINNWEDGVRQRGGFVLLSPREKTWSLRERKRDFCEYKRQALTWHLHTNPICHRQ